MALAIEGIHLFVNWSRDGRELTLVNYRRDIIQVYFAIYDDTSGSHRCANLFPTLFLFLFFFSSLLFLVCIIWLKNWQPVVHFHPAPPSSL